MLPCAAARAIMGTQPVETAAGDIFRNFLLALRGDAHEKNEPEGGAWNTAGRLW